MQIFDTGDVAVASAANDLEIFRKSLHGWKDVVITLTNTGAQAIGDANLKTGPGIHGGTFAKLDTNFTDADGEVRIIAKVPDEGGNDLRVAFVDDQSNGAVESIEVDGLDIILHLAKGAGTASFLETALAGAHNDLRFEAVTPGTDGDSIRIKFQESGIDTPLSVVVDGMDITVILQTDNEVFAVKDIGAGNAKLTFTADAPGTAGNDIRVRYVVAGQSTPLSVTVSVKDITVNIATDAGVSAFLETAQGSNKDLRFTADVVGVGGNDIRVAYVTAGMLTPLSVDVSMNDITVNLETDAGGVAISTAEEIRDAVNADMDAAALVTAAFKTGQDGTGVPVAFALTNLATGAAGAATSTANQVLAAVNANQEANNLLTATLAAGSDGTSVVVAIGFTALATGSDGGSISTADQVHDALLAILEVRELITVALKTGNNGEGIVTALAFTNLASGADGAITTTGARAFTTLNNSAEVKKLVTVELLGAADGSGLVEAFALANLTGGASPPLSTFDDMTFAAMASLGTEDVIVGVAGHAQLIVDGGGAGATTVRAVAEGSLAFTF